MDLSRRSAELWPRPARIERLDGRGPTGAGVRLRGDELVLTRLAPFVAALERETGVPWAVGEADGGRLVDLEVELVPDGGAPTRSRLELRAEGSRLVGASDAALRSGLVTAGQWIGSVDPAAGLASAPAVRVDDEAAIPTRGVLLDTSRDRVPTVSALDRSLDRWASWKLDHAQLYFEHVFAYAGHEEVWEGASAFSPEEIRRFDDRCEALGVELAPCQNSFGHLHRWLRLPAYRDLAEVPAGVAHPWSDVPEPFSLCPIDPRAVDLLADLYDQLLPCFRSGLVNVGGDETFDLGLGRSAAACAERGKGAVWLDFVGELRRLAARHGRRIAVWADIPLSMPEIAERLPDDVLALVWGYEAGHPFAEQADRLAGAGREHWLVPGTSAWNSFAGRWTNALANLSEAATAATASGATGLLVAEWGDNGHLQPPVVAEPALFAGAGLAWRPLDPATIDWPRLLDRHVFRDPTGRVSHAALELGDVWRSTGADPRNGTVLFRLVADWTTDLTHARYGGMSEAGLERAEARTRDAVEGLRDARSSREDAELVRRELEWVADAVILGARLGRARLRAGARVPVAELPRRERVGLADAVGALVEGHGQLWRERSRPGGRRDSARRLETLLEALRS